MKTKQMILAGAILIALATLLMIGADKRTKQVMSTEEDTKYIEEMGDRYRSINY